LSSANILVHEYEEPVAPEIRATCSHSIENIEIKIHGDRQYSKMLMRFKLSIHSKLDEKIRSASNG
jgi:hypothetical protein